MCRDEISSQNMYCPNGKNKTPGDSGAALLACHNEVTVLVVATPKEAKTIIINTLLLPLEK